MFISKAPCTELATCVSLSPSTGRTKGMKQNSKIYSQKRVTNLTIFKTYEKIRSGSRRSCTRHEDVWESRGVVSLILKLRSRR